MFNPIEKATLLKGSGRKVTELRANAYAGRTAEFGTLQGPFAR